MNFANAIRPKMNRHRTTNMTKLFVGVGRLSGTSEAWPDGSMEWGGDQRRSC